MHLGDSEAALNISCCFLTLKAGLTLPVVPFLNITHDSVKGQQNSFPCGFHVYFSHVRFCPVCARHHSLPAEFGADAVAADVWREEAQLLVPLYLLCCLPRRPSLFVSRCLTNSLKSLSGWSRARLNQGYVCLTAESVNWERGQPWWAKQGKWQG